VRLALIFGADPALAHISELAHTAGFCVRRRGGHAAEGCARRTAAVAVAPTERPAFTCEYAAAWSSIASTYVPPLEQADTDTIARILARC
jgi:hypothetical protein